jgi:hypothetical protein
VPRPLALALGVPARALLRLPAPGLYRPIELVGRAATLARDPAASFARELGLALRRAGFSAAAASARTRP